MRDQLRWINDALATREIVLNMSHYCTMGGEIRATDGRITAGHPLDEDVGDYVIPGDELERLLARMPEDFEILERDGWIKITSGRLRGTIETLPIEDWNYPGIEEVTWQPIPDELFDLLGALRPFVSDNAVRPWSQMIALHDGWICATNNIALAGAPFKYSTGMKTGIPVWALDFILPRIEGLAEWFWHDRYVAFRWENGAWLRSVLIEADFPEMAIGMIERAMNHTYVDHIRPEFREVYDRIAGLTGDIIKIGPDTIFGEYKRSKMAEEIHETSVDQITEWTTKYLNPVIEAADIWDPSLWPNPVPFKNHVIAGFVMGRKS